MTYFLCLANTPTRSQPNQNSFKTHQLKEPFSGYSFNHFERLAAATSHMLVSLFYSLPTADFFYRQECDIMWPHSESSDSVLPLATCPAPVPALQTQSECQGTGGPWGNPLPSPTTSPPSLCLYRTDPAVWFVGQVFFSFSFGVICDSRTPPFRHLSPRIGYASLRPNEGKQTYGGSGQHLGQWDLCGRSPGVFANNIHW